MKELQVSLGVLGKGGRLWGNSVIYDRNPQKPPKSALNTDSTPSSSLKYQEICHGGMVLEQSARNKSIKISQLWESPRPGWMGFGAKEISCGRTGKKP